ncbi:S-adenosyl-L-methionine-dependent methyltransferase [Xylaria flabelliformis]|nr:S-adenosyl-L-methionine-dependent methyltransferase [Xylaria flabelliformis]
MESQPQAAARMYDERAPNYEDSWHPDYSRRLMERVPLKPGDRVLIPCCGTGLESFIAADMVGANGLVVGVDISTKMLQGARARRAREPELGSRIKLIYHDVMSLDTCAELQDLRGTFDFLVCSCAFVLFGDPAAVVRAWRPWLKDSGRMVIDITHEKNLIQGVLMEKVAGKLGLIWPSNRQWIRNSDSFKHILEEEGMVVESVELLDNITGKPVSSFGVEDADAQFEYTTNWLLAATFSWEGKKERARDLFREEWENIACDGRVEIVDWLYLYVARKV